MPFVIHIFAISAFALGLAEFVPIGLTSIMADELSVGVETAGATVTAYALGAVFAAPVLTALTANWPRKKVMLIAAFVFTVGALVAPVTANISVILLARFAA
ncbi:MFS transporter [Pseudomonas sp. FSL R10-0399]|uniref:MFS transporter n=1 Tax=Pseudomonas sp. FSL R10-0399 TaxID=2662194 RepID=UPI001295394B|nr:MFS transporter [Pseudomonas sp. FSL R10-0399]MQT59830.1 MFS transporter [Pseudomonas sp. FSL R10-0399]